MVGRELDIRIVVVESGWRVFETVLPMVRLCRPTARNAGRSMAETELRGGSLHSILKPYISENCIYNCRTGVSMVIIKAGWISE